MSGISWNVALSAAAGVAMLFVALVSLILVYRRVRSARYDAEAHRAELDMMRRSIESRLNELTSRLLATEDRWRDANHLLLDSQAYQQLGTGSQVKMNAFLANAGLSPQDLSEDPKLVLVLMPFHPEFRGTFDVIRNVCADLGLHALRGDEDHVPSDILRHVLRLLVKARMVIAVIDGRNPNVFYELGIAHALNKPTILVSSQTTVELPFDVRGRKVLLADSDAALKKLLASEIARSLVER